jgi:GT2 family glycosyltransferase
VSVVRRDQRPPEPIAYVLPTRGRTDELARTLAAIGAIPEHDLSRPGARPAEVIVVDNASDTPVRAPNWLDNGVRVRVLRRETNEGAAGRNAGVRAASADCEWAVLLDDDSFPTDGRFLASLDRQPADVAAVSADITLPDGTRERGGLPEVFIGCGVAVRRWAFLAAGGYDPAFGFYAEEYDLSAKLLTMGRRVAFEPDFRIRHEKTAAQRDMHLILARLVRNNGWVLQRYCPADELDERLAENESRYRSIAEKEGALAGFERGLAELHATIAAQKRTPMDRSLWDRFTGLAAARAGVRAAIAQHGTVRVAIVERGKNDWAVERALIEAGVSIIDEPARADAVVIGTMSPGPMLDANERWTARGARVILPWGGSARAVRRAAA